MFVGLLSDTHGVFSKEFADFLAPVDVIWHAGDWGGSLGFVQQIRDLGKPIVGVYGNCDGLDIRQEFPEYQFFREEGLGILLTHIGGSPGHYYPRAQQLIRACKPDLFVCGHSHILKVQWDGGGVPPEGRATRGTEAGGPSPDGGVSPKGELPKGQCPSPAGFGLAPSVVAADGSVGIRIPWIGSTISASGSRDSGTGSSRSSRSLRADRSRTAAEAGDERPVSAGAVFCNRLIYRLRRPLVSTSANISGEPAPASFAEISPEILAGVDYVVPAAVSGLALHGLSRAVAGQRSDAPPPASRAATSATSARQRPAAPAPSSRQAHSAAVSFDDSATGRPSQILKLGLDGEVEIIRP